jgi:hypothetical protein
MEPSAAPTAQLLAQCGTRLARSDGPNGGVADSLDEAKAAFWAAWQRPLSGRVTDFVGIDRVVASLSHHAGIG